MRPIPVMLALLLALSPGAAAFHAPSQFADSPADDAMAETDTVQPAPNGNTTAVMTLGGDPDRSSFDDPSLALGDALATDRDVFRSQLRVETLDQQLENADSPTQRQQILNRYRYQIENRIISLAAEERAATRAFSNNTLSTSEYLRTLGRIDAAAQETRTLIEAMQTHQSVRNMDTEAGTLKGQLVTLDGPVRNRLGRALQGQAVPTKVYVETTANGVVLSTIAGGEYVREIIRTDRRDSSGSDQMTIHDVRAVIEDRYSWAYKDVGRSRGSSGIDGEYGTTNVYQMWFEHSQGRLEVFYDGGTESVFKEVQHKRLFGEDSLPPGPAVNQSAENLTLTVNRTYPGGPLRVKLTNATGEPLQGEITVRGDPVGRTNSNGVLWTLGPDEQFRTTATYDDRSVNVTTTPVGSPPGSTPTNSS